MYYLCAKFKKAKMKKIILLLSVVLLAVVGCSKSDSSTPTDPSLILPKKVINISNSPDGTSTSDLLYNGNKIIESSETRNGVLYKTVFTYNGDLIVKSESFRANISTDIEEFIYNNNVLTMKFDTENRIDSQTNLPYVKKTKKSYIYNPSGSIIEENFNFINNVYVTANRTTLYTFLNGNLVSTVENNSYQYNNGTNNVTNTNKYTYTYEYDNKNNPLKNILGINKISFGVDSSVNNVIKKTSLTEGTTNNVANPVQPANIRLYTNSYNADNFLTESKYDFQFYLNTNPATYETRTNFTRYFYE